MGAVIGSPARGLRALLSTRRGSLLRLWRGALRGLARRAARGRLRERRRVDLAERARQLGAAEVVHHGLVGRAGLDREVDAAGARRRWRPGALADDVELGARVCDRVEAFLGIGVALVVEDHRPAAGILYEACADLRPRDTGAVPGGEAIFHGRDDNDVAPGRLGVHERHVDDANFARAFRSGRRTEVVRPRRLDVVPTVRQADLDRLARLGHPA